MKKTCTLKDKNMKKTCTLKENSYLCNPFFWRSKSDAEDAQKFFEF